MAYESCATTSVHLAAHALNHVYDVGRLARTVATRNVATRKLRIGTTGVASEASAAAIETPILPGEDVHLIRFTFRGWAAKTLRWKQRRLLLGLLGDSWDLGATACVCILLKRRLRLPCRTLLQARLHGRKLL